jgi:hypothetical protein
MNNFIEEEFMNILEKDFGENKILSFLVDIPGRGEMAAASFIDYVKVFPYNGNLKCFGDIFEHDCKCGLMSLRIAIIWGCDEIFDIASIFSVYFATLPLIDEVITLRMHKEGRNVRDVQMRKNVDVSKFEAGVALETRMYERDEEYCQEILQPGVADHVVADRAE